MRREYNIPELPIALFLKVGLDGIGWDAYEELVWGKSVLRFEYAYIGLPALDAQPYLDRDNPLGIGLAALMKLPKERRAELLLRARTQVAAAPASELGRYVLADCLETYFPLTNAEKQRYKQMNQPKTPDATTVEVPFELPYESIFEKRGRWKREKEILQRLVEKRFGPLSDEVREQIKNLPQERVDPLLLDILDAKSLKDLGLEDGPGTSP